MTKSSKEKTFINKIFLRKNQENTKNILNLKWFMQLYLRKNLFKLKVKKKKRPKKEESSKYKTENAVKKRSKISLGKLNIDE